LGTACGGAHDIGVSSGLPVPSVLDSCIEITVSIVDDGAMVVPPLLSWNPVDTSEPHTAPALPSGRVPPPPDKSMCFISAIQEALLVPHDASSKVERTLCVLDDVPDAHLHQSFLYKSKASLHVARKRGKLKLQSFSGPISLHIHIIQNDSHSHLATLVVAHSLTTLQSSTLLQRPLRALRALRALHSPHVLPIPLKLAQRANFVHV